MLAEHTSIQRTDRVLSPFAFAARRLLEQGYSPLPIMPNGKAPGSYSVQGWRPMSLWSKYCDRQPSSDELQTWEQWPGAGVGIALGRGVIAVDIDRDDLVEPICAVLPINLIGKRGKKGLTLFFRGDTSRIRSRAFKVNGATVLDLLARGKQTVVPPSIHPETGAPYQDSAFFGLADTPCDELPELPDDVENLIADALRPYGFEAEPPVERREVVRQGGEGQKDAFRALNDEALVNLDAWVPNLKLPRSRRHGAGWRAVASWTVSGRGLSDDRREPTLAFDPKGIKDWGDGDQPYTPLDVVIKARGCDLDAAFTWLGAALGHRTEPFINVVAGASAPSVLARSHGHNEALVAVCDVPNNACVVATPFHLSDPSRIPRREWLYGKALIRRFMSVLVAPGGVGKSSLTIVEALAMVSGRPLLGAEPAGRLRVWLWNGEDPRDELERRIAAACLHYNFDKDELGDRLFVDSGRDTRLVVMREVRKELVVAEPVVEAVVSEIIEKHIDVLIVDPFVTTHEVTENDNGAIARVAYLWSSIANRAGCAILLVHHSRKTNGNEVTAEDSRGGIALVGAARVTRVLNTMSTAAAEEFGVRSDERLGLVNIGDGKANMSRRSDRGNWFRLASVPLGNGSGDLDFGDEIAVAVEWAPPSKAARTTLTSMQIDAVKDEITTGEHRLDERSPIWVGNAIVSALGLDPSERGMKKLVKAIIERLMSEGHLRVVEKLDASRKIKTFVEVAAVAAV